MIFFLFHILLILNDDSILKKTVLCLKPSLKAFDKIKNQQ